MAITEQPIKLFQCPSNPLPGQRDGDQQLAATTGWAPLVAVTDYAATTAVTPQLAGLYPSQIHALPGLLARNSRPRIADVTDGTSNTILLTECAGRPQVFRLGRPVGSPGGTPPVRVNGGGWARAASDFDLKGASLDGQIFPGPCAINCTNGLNVGNIFPEPVYGSNGTGETYAFHPGGANVLFGDGSVRFVRSGINIVVYAALVTRAGGEVVSNEDF